MSHYILDENDNPKRVEDTILWADWIQNNNVSVSTEMFSKFNTRVSTVFLGLDYNLNDSGGAPLLYETMILSEHSHWENSAYQKRCSTKELAVVMHDEAVEVVKNWLKGFKTTEDLLGEIIEVWNE